MIRRTLIAAALAPALAIGVLAAPALAQEGAIEPGYWEVTNKVSAIISQTKKEKRCISPSEVDKFMMGPSNRHYKCDYPTRVFRNGKITLKGQCATKNGHKVKLQATGTYSPSSFTMIADVDTTYAGLPISGRATTEAKRIGDTCPPPAAPKAD